jgi:ATP-binding cassette, subfamily B, bacterial PglK
MDTIKKLHSLLTKKERLFLLRLCFFSIIISIVEMLGISVIMPFIAVTMDFNLIHNNEYYSKIFNLFAFDNDINFIISFGVILIFFYIFRSVINLYYLYIVSNFTQNRYLSLSYRLFENYMRMPYKDFLSKNSSVMTKSIVFEALNLTNLISATLIMMSEVLIAVAIYVIMLYVDYEIALYVTVIIILNASLMTKVVSTRIKKAGVLRAETQGRLFEVVNRSFGNFKIIKLKPDSKDTLNSFIDACSKFTQANITNIALGYIPKLFFEAVGFGIVIFIVSYLVWQNQTNISQQVGVVSLFILALYRLLPSGTKIMNSYNQILYYNKALKIVYENLMYDGEKLGNEKISLAKKITIKNLKFEYVENRAVLTDVNLVIKKGSRVAFIGESGCGKSTLVDIIIGLYKPKEGGVFIDDIGLNDSNVKSWRSAIGYIPQNVYLFDGTVGENISFGLDYDKNKVNKVLKIAKIYDFINTMGGHSALVGEGGIMLSGGQKQRIAIARALYGDPEILILDEATSALDATTEKEIMNEIYTISKNKTLIIVAHRLSTLNKCDEIYKLNDGKISDYISY